MNLVSTSRRVRAKLLHQWRSRTFWFKAAAFALIGAVNAIVDYGVFLLARLSFDHSPTAILAFNAVADFCRCGSASSVGLVAANAVSWIVAVTSSYIMNSSITFAHQTGGKLTWRAYATFTVSGIAGWLASTATLLFAADIVLLPIWLAKLTAILASFVVNFSISHLVVFRMPVGRSIKSDH